MLSDTLHVMLHIPLVDKSLQFNLYRIHNIPLVHPVLKKSLKCAIQEYYLTFRSDLQCISSPLNANIMACQVSNGQFCHINSSLCVADTSKSCCYVLFLNDKARITSDCILSLINQIHDEAINVNDNLWAISTLQDDTKLNINLLATQLYHPTIRYMWNLPSRPHSLK